MVFIVLYGGKHLVKFRQMSIIFKKEWVFLGTGYYILVETSLASSDSPLHLTKRL